MELLNALKWRYATKRMNGKKVPAAKVDAIVESIRYSASSLGLQPYRLFVIEDEGVRKEIFEKACQQPQVVEGSHLIVFAALNGVDGSYVDSFIDLISAERGAPKEQLAPYKDMINGFLSSKDSEQLKEWISKQSYIALGTGLVAAAIEGVDATPMEGFNPPALDEILKLKEKNLHSVLLLALGYRDESNDYLVAAKKVRTPKDEFVTVI